MSNEYGPKVALITGASQGIGAGLVEAYRKLGFAVVANSRNIAPSPDPLVLAVPGDVADPAVGRRIVELALERFGRIDTVVNNAGIFIAKPFTEYTAEDYARTIATNVNGFFNVTQPAIAAMTEGGHVVSITTTLAENVDQNVPSVLAALTKGGLNAATKSLAVEYAKKGIRVNAVSPGFIKTPLNPPEIRDFLSGLVPTGAMGEIADIAEAVTYLENAGYVTGEILHVDGGQVAGH
ncbi:SDR family oxidoreductase [Actinoplanes sp. TBRC 11911]|uniref:SDR family NAD(P)-dependent oxidoreductase n=1 Tax=Actinoplanes sp. TBRC 11911 TaxID=2729386 RepID=UPI00145E3665|nr:SDR family oxidoreductase [Actinoplanes sp. TBRC 11911]NMO51170.1 SDR family oxidoreductase [Actinoplanes sp. TBRC 11911]